MAALTLPVTRLVLHLSAYGHEWMLTPVGRACSAPACSTRTAADAVASFQAPLRQHVEIQER